MPDLFPLAEPLLDLCFEAGEKILEHYNAPHADQFEAKKDDSPLTRADIDSHRILVDGLARLDWAWPVLSEESGDEVLAQRRSWEQFWLVDPLDGTREFLERTGEFTINVALVDQHAPVLGLLYQPIARIAHLGIVGRGVWRFSLDANDHLQREVVGCRALPEQGPLALLASRRHGGDRLVGFLEWLEARGYEIERHNSGSALKFCQMADGEGDVYPRFYPCCEWDVAAGQAIVEAAGGAVLGLDGRPLRYNTGDSLLSPHFYALSQPDHTLWQALWDAHG